MKKEYIKPNFEIEEITLDDVITSSTLGEEQAGDTVIDNPWAGLWG